MPKQKVAILTARGLAPCLSAAVGSLIMEYTMPPKPKSRLSADALRRHLTVVLVDCRPRMKLRMSERTISCGDSLFGSFFAVASAAMP
jgi:hypothetical protein